MRWTVSYPERHTDDIDGAELDRAATRVGGAIQ
jgi:hypothetical protein